MGRLSSHCLLNKPSLQIIYLRSTSRGTRAGIVALVSAKASDILRRTCSRVYRFNDLLMRRYLCALATVHRNAVSIVLLPIVINVYETTERVIAIQLKKNNTHTARTHACTHAGTHVCTHAHQLIVVLESYYTLFSDQSIPFQHICSRHYMVYLC